MILHSITFQVPILNFKNELNCKTKLTIKCKKKTFSVNYHIADQMTFCGKKRSEIQKQSECYTITLLILFLHTQSQIFLCRSYALTRNTCTICLFLFIKNKKKNLLEELIYLHFIFITIGRRADHGFCYFKCFYNFLDRNDRRVSKLQELIYFDTVAATAW